MKSLIKLSLLALISISGLKASDATNSAAELISANITLNGVSTYKCSGCDGDHQCSVELKVKASDTETLGDRLVSALLDQHPLKRDSINPDTLTLDITSQDKITESILSAFVDMGKSEIIEMTGKAAHAVLLMLARGLVKLDVSFDTMGRDDSSLVPISEYLDVEGGQSLSSLISSLRGLGVNVFSLPGVRTSQPEE